MILSEITPGKQMLLGGISCRTPAKVIQLPTIEAIVCPCNFVTKCDYEEFAFASPTDTTNAHKNDFKSLLVTLLDTSSTYSFTLVSSNGTETDLDDDTYGVLFDKGFNTLQPLKVGFQVNWLKVYNALGGDVYTIKVKQTDFGTETETESHKFRLMVFSELASQGTVKIRTIQKGVSLQGQDYEGMEWENMNRIVAEFGNETQQNEISRLKDANYQDFDIQNEYFYQYTLSTNLLPSEIADYILNNDTKTDEVFISNYDIYAYRQYRDLPVIAEGNVEPSDDYIRNTNKKFNITFNDNKVNLKRNFQ